MKRIALYGGSFNPPGAHHRAVAEALQEYFDEIHIIPCGPRKDKPFSKDIDPIYRATMVDINFRNLDKTTVELFDLEHETFTTTFELEERFSHLGELAKALEKWIHDYRNGNETLTPRNEESSISNLSDTAASSNDPTIMVQSEGESEESLSEESVRLHCTACGGSLYASPQHIGQRANCPKCGDNIVVPDTSVSERIEQIKAIMYQLVHNANTDNRTEFDDIISRFVLPKAHLWLSAVFGEEIGEKASEEYHLQMPRFAAQLFPFLKSLTEQGDVEVRVRRTEKPSKNELPFVNQAFNKMQQRVVLYSAKFYVQGSDKPPASLAAFVYVQDAFRYVGPMKALA
jgi:nicotinamide mononucleotide adenylyltransferase